MIFCPNKSHSQYKKMSEAFGDSKAHYYYTLKGGDFLSDTEIEQLKNQSDKPKVVYQFKLVELIANKFDTFNKLWNQFKNKNDFFKKLQDNKYGLPKEQVLLLEALYNGQSFNELMFDYITNYSYSVEINTAKGGSKLLETEFNAAAPEWMNEDYLDRERTPGENNTAFYSNLTVPGGTNYTENEIAAPAIIPSIKGHAAFSTDSGIGWFRTDDKIDTKTGSKTITEYRIGTTEDFEQGLIDIEDVHKDIKIVKNNDLGTTESKTRRILEVQSDIFQKSRDIKSAEEIYTEMKKSGELIVDCG